MNDIESLAEKAYEAYCVAVGGVAWNGDKLPGWKEFAADPKKTKQAEGWRVAVKEVLENYDSAGSN